MLEVWVDGVDGTPLKGVDVSFFDGRGELDGDLCADGWGVTGYWVSYG